jgi:Domain of unknown function (DUF4783)
MFLSFRVFLRPLLALTLTWWATSFTEVHAQATNATASADVLGSVKNAIRGGSAKDLAHFFSPSIDLGVDGDKQSYSQTQAEFVVRDFFAKNPPAAFEFVHQGASDAGNPYAIGRYTTKGASYRVFIKMKNQKSGMVIDNLDFTKE